MRPTLLFITVIISVALCSQSEKKNIGRQYPEFTATTLKGETITHEQLVGKITIINFWFQGCPPCVAEFEALEDIYNQFKDNPSFQFLSFTRDPEDMAKESVKKFNLPYIVSSISGDESFRLNLNNAYPTTIITDRAGKIIYQRTGGGITKEANFELLKPAKQLIEKSLNE